MSNPLISIVICCHNRAAMLPATLQSAFDQQYAPVEIVVLDDGSTDETPALMAHYAGRVKYFRQDNQGIAVARTSGCRFATGEFIAFLDDDDLMPLERLTRLYDALRRHPAAAFAVGDWEGIDEHGTRTGERWLPGGALGESDTPLLINDGYEAVLWPRLPVVPHTTLFRRADGERIGWFDTQFRQASEDKDFFARLAATGPVVYVPAVVSYYRRGHVSLTANGIRTECGSLLLFRKHLELLGRERAALRRRLKWRMLTALKRIALYRSRESMAANAVPAETINRWVAALDVADRLKYFWYTRIKLPVRRLVRG